MLARARQFGSRLGHRFTTDVRIRIGNLDELHLRAKNPVEQQIALNFFALCAAQNQHTVQAKFPRRRRCLPTHVRLRRGGRDYCVRALAERIGHQEF